MRFPFLRAINNKLIRWFTVLYNKDLPIISLLLAPTATPMKKDKNKQIKEREKRLCMVPINLLRSMQTLLPWDYAAHADAILTDRSFMGDELTNNESTLPAHVCVYVDGYHCHYWFWILKWSIQTSLSRFYASEGRCPGAMNQRGLSASSMLTCNFI